MLKITGPEEELASLMERLLLERVEGEENQFELADGTILEFQVTDLPDLG